MLAMDDPEGIAMSFGETDVTTLEFICDAARRGGESSHFTHINAVSHGWVRRLRIGNMLAVVRYMRKLNIRSCFRSNAVKRYEHVNLHRPLAI